MAVFRLTRNLEIWMGENFLTPFTVGTSRPNRALEVEDKKQFINYLHIKII